MPNKRHLAPFAAGVLLVAHSPAVLAEANITSDSNYQSEYETVYDKPIEAFSPKSVLRVGTAAVRFQAMAESVQAKSEAYATSDFESTIDVLDAMSLQTAADTYLSNINALSLKAEADKAAARKTQAATVTKRAVSGNLMSWIVEAGVGDADSAAQILMRESGGRPDAINSGGCIGLGQACPGGIKAQLLAECPDWQNQPVCQVKVFDAYANRRYGSWAQALSFWNRNHWY